MAQQVSESEAKVKAMNFFSNGANRLPARKGVKRKAPVVSNVDLAYTSEKDGKTCFYVYNNGTDGGFVIVGGDEVAQEILAYVPQGHFDYDKAPDNLKWWLGQYENEIDTAIITKMSLSLPQKTTEDISWNDIPDLITTKWNQGEPYCNAIPSVVLEGTTYHSPTGCVPTALAQIMNYWKYPIQGLGNKSFETSYSDVDQTITYSADFANTTYDWGNMRDTYEEGLYTDQEAKAVSTLMYHIGVALEVQYGMSQTAYSSIDDIISYNGTYGLMHDLPKYFGYDDGLQLVNREDFTLDQWKSLLYNELLAGRPVYYSGNGGNAGGHAFVCHGYSSTLDMFSFNWGWGGLDDGYFALSGTNAVNGFTARFEEMLIGIRPKGYKSSTEELSFGDKFMADGVWYKVYDERNRQVEVTHTKIIDTDNFEEEDNNDYSEYLNGSVTIPSVVQHNGIDYTVSRIGTCAFMTGNNGQTNVTSISLPHTITSLGCGAFYGCQSLSDSIILPDAIEIIPKRCFEQCNRSQYISIPKSVKCIGKYAFYGCRLLDQISLPEGCYKISSSAFCECPRLSIIDIPSTMRMFGSGCFNGTSLIRMTFRCDNFVSAQTYTDGDYTHINYATPFPNSVGKGTLYVPAEMVDTYRNTSDPFWKMWGNVESIDNFNQNIGKRFRVDEFEYQIFGESSASLSAVLDVDYSKKVMTVPSSVSYEGHSYNVVSLAAGAFAYQGFGVSGIDKLVLSEGIQEIGETALQQCSFKSIELPSTLKKIGRDAFNICHELESIDIPGSVKIVQGVHSCSSLKQVILHEGTQCVGPNFLAGCPKLKEVLLPSTLKYSSGGTMIGCNALSSIVSLTDTLSVAPEKFEWNEESYETLGELVGIYGGGFGSNHESVDLYIPESLLLDAKSDYNNNYPWNDFPKKLSYVAMDSFEISDTINIVVNQQQMIHPSFIPINTSYKQLKWTSSNEEIVMVNCEGYVYGISEGEAIITATAAYDNNIVKSCVIKVHPNNIPSNEVDYCLYQPGKVYDSGFIVKKDTLTFAVTSEGGELYLAFDLSRPYNGSNFACSMGNQTYDIIPTGSSTNTIILHFENVMEQDTLKMLWDHIGKDYGYSSTLIIANLRMWNASHSFKHKQGDINDDGVVNVSDLTALVDMIQSKGTKVGGVADVNDDGQVNVNDVMRLVEIILGK